MNLKLEELTALYSPLDIEYNQVMSGPYEDLSFRSDECTIIAGLKDDRISGFWRPAVAVGDDKLQKAQIDRLYSICPNIYYMDFLIDGKLSVVSQFLLEKGYKAKPYYTQIIDTSQNPVFLHTEIRESYKSLVNKYKDVGYGNISDYRRIHNLTTKDRCEESWKIQQKMIDTKEADCMVDGENAAILIYHNEYSAYYAGGKSVPNFNSHALIWQAIIRNKGKMFELGERVFSPLIDLPEGNYGGMDMTKGTVIDNKLINISKFKKGFGGTTQTRLILEKENQ